MNEKQTDGIRQFRGLLASVRNAVLRTVVNPEGFAKLQNIPPAELGAIVDLTDEQRASVAGVVARSIDMAFASLLYDLDVRPMGLEIGFEGIQINSESELTLSSTDVPQVEGFSEFDRTGTPKN